jgi:hypothetical protein
LDGLGLPWNDSDLVIASQQGSVKVVDLVSSLTVI